MGQGQGALDRQPCMKIGVYDGSDIYLFEVDRGEN
jgi:hypothetical protein